MRYYTPQEKRTLFIYLFIFLLLAVALIVGGYQSYRNFEKLILAQEENQLLAVADLKVKGLVSWRAERLADAEMLHQNDAFAALVQSYFENPQNTTARAQIEVWLKNFKVYNEFDRVRLLDAEGQTRLSNPVEIPDLSPVVAKHIPDVLISKKVTIVDFYFRDNDQQIRLSLLIPIQNVQNEKVIGLVTVSIDPEKYLYPYLKEWPSDSATAESLLVRRDGNNVLFLNDLHFQPDAALSLRIPLENTDVLAVKAALGQDGIVEGVDYRGVAVIGAVRTIPDSPWFLVARMDASEAYTPLRIRLWQTLSLVGMAVFVAGAGLVALWRQQRVQYYRAQAESTQAIRESERQLKEAQVVAGLGSYVLNFASGEWTSSAVLDSIFGIDENFERSIQGWTALIHPVDRQKIADFFANDVIGKRMRFDKEYKILRNNDQVVRWVHGLGELSFDSQGQLVSMLGTIQDITERKQSEDELLQQNKYLAALQETALDLISQLDLKTLLEKIVKRAAQIMNASSGYLDVVDSVSGRLVPQVGFGALAESLQHPAQMGEGVAGTVWQTGQPLVIDRYDEWQGRIGSFSRSKIGAIIGVPLFSGTKILGVLGLAYDPESTSVFDSNAVETLTQFARLASVAIENARFFEIAQQELHERKQTEIALKETNEYLDNLFNYTNAPIIVWDPQFKVTRFNHAFEDLTGRNESDLLGKTLEILFPSNQVESSMNLISKTLTGERWEVVEINIQHVDGSIRTVLWNSATLFSSDGETPIATIAQGQDITDRKQAENALRESEDKFKYVFEYSVIGKSITQINGRMQVNKALCDMLGYSFEEMQNKKWYEITHPDDVEMTQIHIDTLASGAKESVRFVKRFIHKDGSIVWVDLSSTIRRDSNNQPLYLMSAVIDITDRKRTENMIEARLRLVEFSAHHTLDELLTKTLDEVCVMMDSPIGFYHFVDSDQITLSLQAWSTRTMQEYCKAEGKGSHYPVEQAGIWADCVRLKQPVIHNDYASLPASQKKGLPQGHAVLIRELVVPIMREDWVVAILGIGNKPQEYTQKDVDVVTYFADVAWEIAERKRAELQLAEYTENLEAMVEERTHALKDAQEKLVRQERLALLGQVAGSMGHELRNPLGVISNAIYFLKLAQPNANDQIKEYLDIIEKETYTSDKIITDLLDFSRIKATDRKAVSVSELIYQTLNRFPAPSTVDVILNIPVDLPSVFVDAQQVSQILGNLTVNACQSMPDGGQLTVDSSLCIVDGGQWVRIAIKDTGVGITPENMKKLFEPLFSTKIKGVGLGLAVSLKLIEANDGRIEVTSEAGVGSTFTVFLPL